MAGRDARMAGCVLILQHRHRSVVMHMADDGEVVDRPRLANDLATLAAEALKTCDVPE
jgi:hypothetical protein